MSIHERKLSQHQVEFLKEKKREEISSVAGGDSRFAGPSPSPRASGWHSSASPESDRGHSRAAASSSEDHGPPPRPEFKSFFK